MTIGPDDYGDFLDDDDDGAEDNLIDCGFIPGEGLCTKAGTEECDWECPHNPCDPEGL